MLKKLVINKTITISNFSFTNKSGGTGCSNWEFNEKFEKPVKVKVIKRWDDYECGERGWAVPEKETKLIEYLKRNAMNGVPIKTDYTDSDAPRTDRSNVFVIFVNEFNIVKKNDKI